MSPFRAAALVAIGLALVRCSYDWTVAPGPASIDAGGDAAPVDATAPVDAPPDVPALGDAAPPPPDCKTLAADLADAKAVAKQCVSGPSACQESVTDECGCKQIVGALDQRKVDYQNAVAVFLEAGCTGICPNPGSCPTAMPGLCVAAPDGGTACSQ